MPTRSPTRTPSTCSSTVRSGSPTTPTLPAELDTLAKYVSGQDRMAMSPYPGLKTTISLQAWGYQLFVDSATDPRIQQFIDALRYNPKTTPEYGPTARTRPSRPIRARSAIRCGLRRRDGCRDPEAPRRARASEPDEAPTGRRPLTVILVCVLAVAALVIAGTTGWLVGSSSDTPRRHGQLGRRRVRPRHVDAPPAGHHDGRLRPRQHERSVDQVLARDIETSQTFSSAR